MLTEFAILGDLENFFRINKSFNAHQVIEDLYCHSNKYLHWKLAKMKLLRYLLGCIKFVFCCQASSACAQNAWCRIWPTFCLDTTLDADLVGIKGNKVQFSNNFTVLRSSYNHTKCTLSTLGEWLDYSSRQSWIRSHQWPLWPNHFLSWECLSRPNPI